MTLLKYLLAGGTLVLVQRIAFDAYFFFGWSSSLAPLEVKDSSVFILPSTGKIKSTRKKQLKQEEETRSIAIAIFDDRSWNNDSNTRLLPTWHLHGSDENVRTSQVNANSCFTRDSSIRCLPAVYIVGFEKCGTTVLNIWLSYHPNLKTNWIEARFFDKQKLNLTDAWHGYLSQLPKLQKSDIGKIWTFEKSPAYSTNPAAAKAMSRLVPDARIVFLIRNPTQRAYSMFLMYTHHYMDVTQAVFGRPVSFFVKNMRTNAVHYVKDYKLKKVPPGVGGTVVDSTSLHANQRNDTWVYLSYPPSPRDFHRFANRIIKYMGTHNMTEQIFRQSRGTRVITGGLYGNFLAEIWLNQFEPHQLILIPSETFFDNSKVLENMKSLQHLLGLPVFDYSGIASNITGRMEIPASLGTVLNKKFNANVQDALPMLPKTKKLLDDFYCESNRKLQNMMGGRAVPHGYSCGNIKQLTKT